MECGLLELHKLFGKKWTYGLIHNIEEEPKSFNDLHNLSKRKINPTLLSERLSQLEKFNLINRREKDDRVFYSITEEGKKLKEIFLDIKDLAQSLELNLPESCEEGNCSGCRAFKKQD